jgi:nucleoid-associated protein YgaU
VKLEKAYLCELDAPSKKVDFHFNPTTIQFEKKAEFRREPSQAAADAPPVQFKGTQSTDLNLTLLLDAVEKAGGTVVPEVEQLLGWTTPATESTDTTSPSPPKLLFNWGKLKIGTADKFVGHLERVGVHYLLFAPDGTPIRAEVSLTLKSVPQGPGAGNPTSGGRHPYRTHQLSRGETLQSVAWSTYGDPGLWRAIALANEVDDPLRLPPGRELLLPAVAELQEVQRNGGR